MKKYVVFVLKNDSLEKPSNEKIEVVEKIFCATLLEAEILKLRYKKKYLENRIQILEFFFWEVESQERMRSTSLNPSVV